jgi:hypothetical protein
VVNEVYAMGVRLCVGLCVCVKEREREREREREECIVVCVSRIMCVYCVCFCVS